MCNSFARSLETIDTPQGKAGVGGDEQNSQGCDAECRLHGRLLFEVARSEPRQHAVRARSIYSDDIPPVPARDFCRRTTTRAKGYRADYRCSSVGLDPFCTIGPFRCFTFTQSSPWTYGTKCQLPSCIIRCLGPCERNFVIVSRLRARDMFAAFAW